MEYFRYDSGGRQILHANASAVTGYNESYADLVNYVSNNAQYLSDGSGLVEHREYYDSTTASTSNSGAVLNYLKDTSVSHGETGTKYYQSLTKYIKHTVSSVDFIWIAESTMFTGSVTNIGSFSSADARTTTYSYSWISGTNGLYSKTITLPTISSTNNGPNSTVASTDVFDEYGRVVWSKDADEYIRYNAYDPATGAVARTIQDVNTATTSHFADLPSGWTTLGSGGLHLKTDYVVDSLGRTTKVTDSAGNVTFTVYNDTNKEVRTYRGWNNTSHQPTLPVTLTRTDTVRGYTESLTYHWTDGGGLPVDGGGKPTGAEPLSGTASHAVLLSLTRSYNNGGGQMVRSDSYFDLAGVTYSAAAYIGTQNTNFYTTTYGYNVRGQQARVVNSNQTITITTYDVLGRQRAVYMGTDDSAGVDFNGSGGSPNWEDFIYKVNANPTDVPTSSNMTLVSLVEYDNGGVGDGNLTQTKQYPGASMVTRVTQSFYDWRNRLVATKGAVQNSGLSNGTETTSDNTHFITYTDLNNAGETLAISTYDGDTIDITYTSGVPNKPSSSLLRSYTINTHDEQGRAFRTTTHSVNPADGSYQTSSAYTVVSNAWFDKRGNTIASHTSGGPMSKMLYDGAGRVTKSYVTDGGAVNNSGSIRTGWSYASTVTSDVVLEQSENTYDSNSNVLLTTARQRFHTNSSAMGELQAANNTAGLAARVSHLATYYDSVNRPTHVVNVGTNGGTAFTRQPNATQNTGALITAYAYETSGSGYNYETTTDPRGIVSFRRFDALGRVVKTIAAYDTGVNTGQPHASYPDKNQTTLYTYDGSNHILTLRADMPSGSNDQTTEYVYTAATAASLAAGQSISFTPAIQSNDMLWLVKYPDKTLGTAGTTSSYWNLFNYSALGETLTKRDQNGNTHTYTYDILGRLTSDSASMKPTTNIVVGATLIHDPGFDEQNGTWVYRPSHDHWSFTGDAGTYGFTSIGYGAFIETNASYVSEEESTGTTGSISQSIYLGIGTFQFAISAVQYLSVSPQTLYVYLDSNLIASITPGVNLRTYLTSAVVMTSAGSHTLTITGDAYEEEGDYKAVAITDVNVVAATSAVADPGFESINVGGYGNYAVGPTSSNWTFTHGAGVAANGSALGVAYNHGGSQAGFVQVDSNASYPLSEPGVLSQNVSLAVGTYLIRFYMQSTSATVDVRVGTTSVGEFVGSGTTTDGVYASALFTISTGGTYNIKFELTSWASDETVFLDDITIAAVQGSALLGTLVASQRVVTTYNTQGLVDTITTYDEASGGAVVNQIKYEYNGFGQMTREYQQHGASVNTGTSLSVQYAYNASDLDKYGSRLTSMTYPSGRVLSYRYSDDGTHDGSLNDLISRLDNLAESGTVTLESYQYLGLSTIIERAQPQANLKLTYIAQGTSDHASDSGASDPYVGLDRFGRVVDQRWRSTGGSPADVDRYQYTYDANSNRTAKDNVLSSGFNEDYTYDNLNRLTGTDRSSGTTHDQSWTLDALGNMSSVTTNGIAENRTHNSANQIVNIAGETLAYDSNGNLTTDDQGFTLVYDAWNRLVAVKTSAGILLKGYVYDGLGRRVTETDGWGSTDLYYSGTWQVLEERKGVTNGLGASASSNGYAVAQYVFSPVYVNAAIVRDRDSDNDGSHTLDERLVFTADANFNVTAMLNASGTVQQRFVYDAYGQFIVANSGWTVQAGDTLSIRHTFQGGWQDLNTGLISFQMRDYNPRTYTWNMQDPLGFVDGANLYGFNRQNSVNSVDPTGLKKILVIFEGAASFFGPTLWNALDDYFRLTPYDASPGELGNKAKEGEFIFLRYGTGNFGLPGMHFPNNAGVDAALQDIKPLLEPDSCGLFNTIAVIGHSWGGDATWEFLGRLAGQFKAKANLVATYDARPRFGNGVGSRRASDVWDNGYWKRRGFEWPFLSPDGPWFNYHREDKRADFSQYPLGGFWLPGDVINEEYPRKGFFGHFSIVRDRIGEFVENFKSMNEVRHALSG